MPSVHPYRPKFIFESLENRLLLAAVGSPSSANGWNTTGSVGVTASTFHQGSTERPPVRTIDGSGLDLATGLLHEGPQGNPPDPGLTQWLSAATSGGANPGTVAGSQWLRFEFDQAYPIDNMLIWNGNEAHSQFNYRSMGMKDVTIQYSQTGGSNPVEWSTSFDGRIPQASGGSDPLFDIPVSRTVDFNGATARYVVITADSGINQNWSNGEYTHISLSEVRFNIEGVVATPWRNVQYRNTLSTPTIEAKFQAGLLYQLRNPATGEMFINLDPAQLSAAQSIFGASGVNLDNAVVTQTVSPTLVNTHLQFSSGGAWDINWSLSGNDLILQTSAVTTSPVGMFAYTIDNSSIVNHKLVTVDQNGVAHAIQAPYTGTVFGGDRTSMPATLTQPLTALYQGASSGWWVEGRDLNVGPSNLRAYGEGQTADLVISRGYQHQPTTAPSLYEVRLRTYQGAWQDAVDPYTNWMQTGLGYVPLTSQSPSWVKNIKTQAYVTVTDYASLNALAARLNPAETYLGRQAEYRNFAFDIGYPDYSVTPASASWITYARSLGFHVGVHVNIGSIDRANTALLAQMEPGLFQTGTNGQGQPIYDGTANNAYVSAAYQPWRAYLINAVSAVIAAGADVIYLDQTNGVLGKFFVNGVTGTQGVMLLEQELKAAYPNIAIQTEQFNTMSSRHASFALTTMNLGHPLSGYIFTKFIKIVPEGYYYQPVDVPTMDQFQNWGHFTPGASNDETWLQIAGAFQQYDLIPNSRLPRNANQLSGFSGPNGVTGYFEQVGSTRKFVVYRPSFPALDFGVRQTSITQWSGPGYLKDWLIYNGNTMLGLDPAQTYFMDPTVSLDQNRFHLTAIPADFAGYSHSDRRIVSQEQSFTDNHFRIFFSGHGTMQMHVPDNYDVYLNNQKVTVNRNTDTATVNVSANPSSPAVLRTFKRLETNLTGKWASLPYSWPKHLNAYLSTADSLFQPDGFFQLVAGTGMLVGKVPYAQSVRLTGAFKMRNNAFNSIADGVIRINGTEVLRLSPGSGPPFTQKNFDVDITAFAGQYIMFEFSADGEIHGPDAADWIAPQFVVTNLLTRIPGDTDLDGDVDLNDLSRLSEFYGTAGGATWGDGDFDGDGDVDLSDLSALAANYGTASAQTFAVDTLVTAAPEPVIESKETLTRESRKDSRREKKSREKKPKQTIAPRPLQKPAEPSRAISRR